MPGNMDAQGARNLIDAVMNDHGGPHFDADDPDHSAAVDEMLTLNKSIHEGAELGRPEATVPVLSDAYGGAGGKLQRSPERSKPPFYPPVLQNEADRKRSIIQDTPARFEVAPDPAADGSEPLHVLGAFEDVTANDAVIHETSGRYGVDPDLVWAIVYVKSTQGYCDRLAETWDALACKGAFGPGGQGRRRGPYKHRHKTIRPMNVHAELWRSLGITREKRNKPGPNIEAGVRILRSLMDRMPQASVAQLATAYNSLAKERVSDYGARVSRVYEEKPWARDR